MPTPFTAARALSAHITAVKANCSVLHSFSDTVYRLLSKKRWIARVSKYQITNCDGFQTLYFLHKTVLRF